MDVQAGRNDWTRCEVHCLMCGRLLGRLLANRFAGETIVVIAFRPMDPPGPIVIRWTPRLIRCRTCHGAGTVDEIEVFSTYAPVGSVDDLPAKRRPGRPARRFMDEPARTPLQAALAEL